MKSLYYSLVLVLLFMSVYLLKESCTYKRTKIKFKNHRFRKMRSEVTRKLNEKDTLFLGSGISINRYQYNMIRIIVLATLFVFQILDSNSIAKYIFFLILFLITSPIMDIFNKKTPFAMVLELFKNNYRKKIDLELYNSISQLKNLVIVQKDHPMSADFLIEQLVRFTNKTKIIYLHTLSIMREGKDKDAIAYFKQSIQSKLGTDFANILAKLDYINPAELKQQLVLTQSSYRNEKVTMKLAQEEMLSHIIFLPIIAVAIVILLNFVIITVWLDSLYKMLNL